MNRRTPIPAAIADRAADWLGRSDAGLSPAERDEFEAWRAADSRHAAAWSELVAASCALDGLDHFRPAAAHAPDPDLPLRRAATRRRRWPVAATLATAAAAALAVWFGLPDREDRAAFGESAVTAVGAQRTLRLPDGSVITLNTDSAVRVAFTARERRLDLERGEAHFAVAKDATRPFVVETASVRVRAVGTAFNIRLQGAAVEVLVTEGKVGVLAARGGTSLLPSTAPAPVLAAGHRATVAADAQAPAVVAAVSALEIAQKMAWQERRLEFDPTPLAEVVAEFNRYGPRRLVIADPGIARLSIGGSFRAGDTATLVRLLETNFGVAAETTGEEIRLRRK